MNVSVEDLVMCRLVSKLEGGKKTSNNFGMPS